MFTTRRSSFVFSNVTKKVTQARKGLGTNSVALATELSLVSKLLQKVIPKKISADRLHRTHLTPPFHGWPITTTIFENLSLTKDL